MTITISKLTEFSQYCHGFICTAMVIILIAKRKQTCRFLSVHLVHANVMFSIILLIVLSMEAVSQTLTVLCKHLSLEFWFEALFNYFFCFVYVFIVHCYIFCEKLSKTLKLILHSIIESRGTFASKFYMQPVHHHSFGNFWSDWLIISHF